MGEPSASGAPVDILETPGGRSTARSPTRTSTILVAAVGLALACGPLGPARSAPTLLDLHPGDVFAGGTVVEAGAERVELTTEQRHFDQMEAIGSELEGRGWVERSCSVQVEEPLQVEDCTRWRDPEGLLLEVVGEPARGRDRAEIGLAVVHPRSIRRHALPPGAPWDDLVRTGVDRVLSGGRVCHTTWLEGAAAPVWLAPDGTVSGRHDTADQLSGNDGVIELEGRWRATGTTLSIEGRWTTLDDGSVWQDGSQRVQVQSTYERPGYAFLQTAREVVGCGEGADRVGITVFDGGGGPELTRYIAWLAAGWGVVDPRSRLVLDGGTAQRSRSGIEVLYGRAGHDEALALLTYLEQHHPESAFSLEEWPDADAPTLLVVVVGGTPDADPDRPTSRRRG